MKVLELLGGRPLCWVLGHRVGPARLRREVTHDQIRVVSVSSCTRCGHAFVGEPP